MAQILCEDTISSEIVQRRILLNIEIYTYTAKASWHHDAVASDKLFITYRHK